MEKLKKRTHLELDEEVDTDQALQRRQREEKEAELKQEMDQMPIPDLTVKQAETVSVSAKPKYRGYLLLWSGSSGCENETYNKIQLMNLKKYVETNGKQKPYIFHLQSMEKSLFKKNIQFTSSFDRHWFGGDIVTNNEWMPKYIEQAIGKLNYNPMNNEYIKKWASNVSSFQQKWNLRKLSFSKSLSPEPKEKQTQTQTPKAKTDEQLDPTAQSENQMNAESDKQLVDLVFDVNKNYSMIFRCGGVYAFNKQRCTDCDLTVFPHLHDANVINGYTLNLPALPVATSLTSTVYNHYNGVLYVIAGDTDQEDVTSHIFQLNLNKEKCEWKRSSVKLYNARKSVCSCLIDAHNIMIMGGKSKSGEKLSSVELFVNTANNVDAEINRYRTTKLLAPLCFPRSASGSLLFDESDKRVIIGGGWAGWSDVNDDTKRTIEFWDAHKNKWTLFPYKTNYEHQFSPILWNDKYGNGINAGNPNVIYIAGDCVGIDSKSVLGNIEWIDIRESKSNQKWNTFANETNMLQMFSLQDVDEKIWRSRSLLIA